MQMVFLITGVFLAITGFLIWKFKVVEILRMYNPKTCKDKDGLARWTGIRFMLAGLASASAFFLPAYLINGNFPIFLYLVFIVVVLAIAAYGTRKFS